MAIRINVPPITRLLIALLLALSGCYLLAEKNRTVLSNRENGPSSAVLYLTLVPRYCVYYPWTIITSTFVERSFVSFLLSGANTFLAGKYLERAWGSKEFAKVVLVASTMSNLVVVSIYIMTSYVNDPGWSKPISGGVSLQAAFLVAFKQLVPEHTVSIFKGLVKMRVKHFPALFLLVNTLAGLLLGYHSAAMFAWLGLVTTWTYLRFYKRQPELSATTTGGGELRGDASETFAFAAFFPDKIQAPIALVSEQIYGALITLRICTPFSDEEIESGNQQAATRGEAGLPSLLNSGGRTGRETGRREEAERRRALALQALDQRLNQANNSKPATSQPTSATVAMSSTPASSAVEGEAEKS